MTAAETALATLLVVDDETDIAEELCEFLSDEGYRTILCSSLTQARAKIHDIHARGGVIDLVISDLRMPGGSGVDLIAVARDLNMDAPFILVTGHGDIVNDAAQTSGLAASGAALVLKKPVEIDRLLEEIARLLGTAQT